MAVLLTFIRIHNVTTMTPPRTAIVTPTGIATYSRRPALLCRGASSVPLTVSVGTNGVVEGSGWEKEWAQRCLQTESLCIAYSKSGYQ